MIFLEDLQIIPWKEHAYNDGIAFNFRSSRVYAEDVRYYPASRGGAGMYNIHQEFRVDGGSFLNVPMTGFSSVGANMTKVGNLGYVPGKDAQTTLASATYNYGWASRFDTTKKMWLLTRNTPGKTTNSTEITIRPYAVIAIGNPTVYDTVVPAYWSLNYRRRGQSTFESATFDIDPRQVELVKGTMRVSNLYWKVFAIKSPTGYRPEDSGGASYYAGEVEEVGMPVLGFTGTPDADTQFGFFELGCEITRWSFLYN